MVVDHSKPPSVRARAVDPPIRIATINLAVLMSVADDVLDLKAAQASVAQAKLSVVRPNEALDLHGRSLFAVQADIGCLARLNASAPSAYHTADRIRITLVSLMRSHHPA